MGKLLTITRTDWRLCRVKFGIIANAIERAVVAPAPEIIVHRAARRQVFGKCRTLAPVLRMYFRPSTTSRTTTVHAGRTDRAPAPSGSRPAACRCDTRRRFGRHIPACGSDHRTIQSA
jgi:hypothetical protein